VNTLKLSVGAGLAYVQARERERAGLVQGEGSELCGVDCFIPSLIVIPPPSPAPSDSSGGGGERRRSGYGEDAMVKSGCLIIQDKSSCFPSQILCNHLERFREKEGGEGGGGRFDVIDACAAPGNKTSHIAALLTANNPNISRIFAFDKSKERAELLVKRMAEAAADKMVTVFNKDFLELNPTDTQYADVKAILLDPSCSGSGLIRAIDRISEYHSVQQKQRIIKLQSFQSQALLKAMSFPNVSLIVYSTCSINIEENESVVATALLQSRQKQEEESLFGPWNLSNPVGFESWPRRGYCNTDSSSTLNKIESDKLIRCLATDGMSGFFVAVFTRSLNVQVKVPVPVDEKPSEFIRNKKRKSLHIGNSPSSKSPLTHSLFSKKFRVQHHKSSRK
jgi:16S rRNA C967 or C1407 C5-methylase (RsmB/RsmF family)